MKREKLGAPKTIDFWFDSTSLVAQTVKRQPTMWETRLQSLGREYLLEKEMATHSNILAWEICSPPGSSVHGIFQARILEWVAIPFSRGSSPPRD